MGIRVQEHAGCRLEALTGLPVSRGLRRGRAQPVRQRRTSRRQPEEREQVAAAVGRAVHSAPMQTPLTRHLGIEMQRCLNSRSAGEFCRICVDTCPERALELAADGIRFDASQCHECALCVVDCPTGAYTHTGFSATELPASAEGRESVDIHCQFSAGEGAGEGELLIPCHGLLGDRLLAGLHAAGVRVLHLHGTEQCDTCPSRVGAGRLARTVQQAEPEVARYFPALQQDSAADVPRQAASGPALARRGFIGQMARGVAYAAIHTLPGSLQTDAARRISPGRHGFTAKHLPELQRLALDLHGRGVTAASWFYQLQAGESCDACNICSFGCPTDSLSIEESGQLRRLRHRPASCLGCGLCLALCPQQALQFCPPDAEMIREEGSITLVEYGQEICSTCGAAFVGSGDQAPLCPPCANERAIQEQWLNL